MLKLRDVLQDRSGEWQGFLPDELKAEPDEWTWQGLGRGTNLGGGGPWTQYWFARHLFWRLDAYKPLRLMIYLSNAEGRVEENEVYEYRDRFNEALQQERLASRDIRMRKGNEWGIIRNTAQV